MKRKNVILSALLLIIILSIRLLYSRPQAVSTPHEASVQQIAQTIIGACEHSKREGFCYSEQFSTITRTYTLSQALSVLSAVQERDSSTRACHFIAHSIAAAEMSKHGNDWKKVIATMPIEQCTGGFIMGVMEAYNLHDKNFVVNEKTIPEICTIMNEQAGKGSDLSCAHIMGHLLLVEKSGDISRSVEVCNKVPDHFQYECYAGVFMESEIRRNLVSHGIGELLPWTEKTTYDQQLICNNQQQDAAQACWRELSHMIVFVANSMPQEVFRSCQQALRLEEQKECYIHGVGIMTLSARFEETNMKHLCSPYEHDDSTLKRCIGIVVDSMLQSSSSYTDRARSFCLNVPYQYTQYCLQKIN